MGETVIMEPKEQLAPQPDEWTAERIELARAAQQREIEQETREFRLRQENRRHEPRQTRKRD